MRRELKAALNLGRVANLPTVWSNVLAAWWISAADFPEPAVDGLAGTLLVAGASLMYVGGTTLNDACDVAFDRLHRPERPIPSGVLSRAQVWSLGVAELMAGALLLLIAGVAWLPVALLTAAIVLYDLVHKRWVGAVWIMGLCRGLLWIVPATLPGHRLNALCWLWAMLLLVYIAGVSLTARGESLPQTGHPVVAPLLIFVPAAGWLWQTMEWGEARWQAAIFLFVFLACAARAVQTMRRHPPVSIGPAVGWLLAGIPLVDALALSIQAPALAFIVALGLPLTRFLQKYFAST